MPDTPMPLEAPGVQDLHDTPDRAYAPKAAYFRAPDTLAGG